MPQIEFPDAPIEGDIFVDENLYEWLCIGTSPNMWKKSMLSPSIKWLNVNGGDINAGYGFRVDTTNTALTVTLPLHPDNADRVGVSDRYGTFELNNLTVLRSGRKIMQLEEDLILGQNWATLILEYDVTDDNWFIVTNT